MISVRWSRNPATSIRAKTFAARNLAHRQCGHTLLELMVAMAASVVLLAGIASTVFVVSRGAEFAGPTADTIKASKVVHNLTDEIRYAIFITNRSERMIQFAVADRDGDDQPDVICYEWSGTPGDPLVRTFNHGTPRTVAVNVHAFALTYNTRARNEEFYRADESPETEFVNYTSPAQTSDFDVTFLTWAGQYFHPSEFNVTPLPADATSWSVTRVEFQAKQALAVAGSTSVQLRPATGDKKPTSTVLEQSVMQESTLGTNYSWQTFPFANVSQLTPNEGLCLVLKWESDWISARIRKTDVNGMGHLSSFIGGAIWTYFGDRSLLYRVYGKYVAPSATPVSVSRHYLTHVNVALQLGESDYSRIDTGVNLLNSPELLSAYWKLDFDSDPTAVDANFDDISDWVEESGVFNPASLVGGVWHADQADGVAIRTAPDNDFTRPTTIELKCRNTSVGGLGANFWMSFDRSGGEYGQVYTSVVLQADGTQTVRVYSGDSVSDTLLVEVPGLASGFVQIRLVIVPDQDVIGVWIDQSFRGGFIYRRFSSHNQRYFAAQPDGSDAEFDYISVRVSGGG